MDPLIALVGRNFMMQRRFFLVKTNIESMLDESGFDSDPKMVGFALEKLPELSLAPESFGISIFILSASVGAAAKRSISNTFSILVP